MRLLSDIITKLDEYNRLEKAVETGKMPACVNGVSVIHKAHIIHSLCERTKKRCIVIASGEAEGARLCSDINAMGGKALFYPSRDFNFKNVKGQSREFEHMRIDVLSKMLEGDYTAVVCCADAAMQFTVPPKNLKNYKICLKAGQEISVDRVTEALLAAGYEPCEQIEGPGQFARRGGILDLFAPDSTQPVRVDFWGDEIDSISYFDVISQRRGDSVKSVEILPSNEIFMQDLLLLSERIKKFAEDLKGKSSAAKENLLNEAQSMEAGERPGSFDKYIPLIYERSATVFDYHDGLIFVSENNGVKDRARTFEWQTNEDLKGFLADGTLCRGLDSFSLDMTELYRKFDYNTVYLNSFTVGGYETELKTLINITATQLPVWSGSIDVLSDDVRAMTGRNMAVLVLAGTAQNADFVAEELKKEGLPAERAVDPRSLSIGKIYVTEGVLSAGFEYPHAFFGLITAGKSSGASGEYSVKGLGRAKQKKKYKGKAIFSLAELTPGDYVVHSGYGIGVFDGIHTIKVKNGTAEFPKEFIKIKYAKGDIVYVPVTQMDLVSKYIGSQEDGNVRLSSISSGEWQKTKSRVRNAVKDIAKELISLYSQRMKVKGHAFPEDTPWQRDFEAKFEYIETDDQLNCADEIRRDMQSSVPMDRLLCGDVGFGKTEVALRAAFRCITDSKQVAFLVPTTILARQHYQTTLSRMEGFPVNVQVLTRYTTASRKKEILEGLKNGSVDMVIGTHSLLQKTVEFHDLGLVIIDEEQRFGVNQKEKLKMRFKDIDCLTLSATPIPRTLNMALSGMRDMSIIEEPPQDRHPIQTYVLEYDVGIITESIKRELRRGGQVYYLHNNIETIDICAAKVSSMVPEAKIGIAHGQMSEDEIGEVWRKLIDNEINVLVCTTIIETGVDVSNVNTLIIEDSDHFGLSQLHQIRGRVGRSARRAYCYLTFRPSKVLTEVSYKRLQAVREFTEFGSGFKIAMRDMEIRGAGNVLGSQQHGNMEAVGYDLYLKLLEKAIKEEKGEQTEKDEECLIDVRSDARIDENYIPYLKQRLDMYRLIAAIRTDEDVDDVVDELVDRFGEPPSNVMALVRVAKIKATAQRCNVKEIRQTDEGFLMTFYTLTPEVYTAFANGLSPLKVKIVKNEPIILCVSYNKKHSPVTSLEDVTAVLEKAFNDVNS